MLRLVELGLFLAPLVAFLAWRWLSPAGGPSLRLVIGTACTLALLAGTLIWLSVHQALPPDTSYAPARLEDGRIVSGHAAAR